MTSSDAIVMIGGEMVGTGFGGISLMELFNEFVGVREIGSGGPLKLFVGSFVAHPSDVVE